MSPEVSKSEGRVAQTTNVVIGGTVTDDATDEWLVLDQKVLLYFFPLSSYGMAIIHLCQCLCLYVYVPAYTYETLLLRKSPFAQIHIHE